MGKDNFDEILEKTLKEYVKESEAKNVNVPKIRFSKRHEANMEKLFKAVENGNLGDIESNKKDTRSKNIIDFATLKKSNYMKYIKIAVFILIALVTSMAIAPTMRAWRKEDISVYSRSRNNYAWLLKNDKTETIESTNSDYQEYMEAFGYLPDGFEIESVVSDSMNLYIKFKNLEEEEIILKVSHNINNAIDFKENYLKKIEKEKFEILFFEKEILDIFVWEYDEKEYYIYANNKFDEIIKMIENINFEKF